MDNVIIFGAGSNSHLLLRKCKDNPGIYRDHIQTVFDNNPDSIGKKIGELTVEKPVFREEYKNSKIVITPDSHRDDIVEQLISQLSFSREQILFIEEYERKLFIHSQYINSLSGKEKKSITLPSKIVVYTAIFGAYDSLKEPLCTPDGIKYVVYTDDPDLKSDIWEVRYVAGSGNPALQTRDYKLRPHLYFDEYDMSIWVDGSMQITGDLREMLKKYLIGSSILFFPHMERNCIYDEAAVVLRNHLAAKEKLVKQLTYYSECGFPLEHGLVCGGFMARMHKDKTVINVMNEWWEQVNKYSARDQISLPFVLWKNDCPYDLTDDDCYMNQWFYIIKHNVVR